MWKFSNKGKHVELHMILLEEFIVLLQKQDDKYVLKFHTVTGREISPIVKNENILVRPMATGEEGVGQGEAGTCAVVWGVALEQGPPGTERYRCCDRQGVG